MTRPPLRRTETPIKVSFPAASIQAAREVAGRLGGGIDGPEAEWTWRGESDWEDGQDPEGNVFQVRTAVPRDAREDSLLPLVRRSGAMKVQDATRRGRAGSGGRPLPVQAVVL
jgi:hypothetical protein